MFFADRITLGTPRRTKEGYMAVRAKAARAGVYDYLGRELDPKGEHFAADQVVKVYRPESEVFAQDAVHSFLLKPITDDHPSKPITADNWQGQAKGVNAGALRDGEYLAFDLVLMDSDMIAKVEAGKRELSNGYSSDIGIEDGTAPDGTAYDAVQRHIRGNHIAIVRAGRAGHECRIGDVATCDTATVELLERLLDERTYTELGDDGKKARQRREAVDNGVSQMATKTIQFDGMPIEATDQAESAIRKLEGQLADSAKAKAAAETKVGELTATVATKDGEIAGLNQKLKDAEVGPAQLEKLVADRSAVIAKAKTIVPAVVTDGKSDAEIRAAVVAAKLGDAAPTDENGIAGAFAALTADAKPDPVRDALKSMPANVLDSAAAVQSIRSQRYN
jgi:hypothetical protein